VSLHGSHVHLDPLDTYHAKEWIEQACEESAAGRQIPFAIIHLASGRAVGSTRYLDIRREDRGIEIGWTWLGKAYQRTAMNTECKWLLLRHAFETLAAHRVQLKTDLRNLASQRAIERLGAVREGVLRRHMLLPDGHLRDSVYYSILDTEWPAVKERLLRWLQHGQA
jgi:RimJ/RimL family protein N-acetyltransferase